MPQADQRRHGIEQPACRGRRNRVHAPLEHDIDDPEPVRRGHLRPSGVGRNRAKRIQQIASRHAPRLAHSCIAAWQQHRT
jgi:hypothetical protein